MGTCKICGDPKAYSIWIGPEPPGCPYDEVWHKGGLPSIFSVTECSHQMRKAARAAKWRRVCPEAFDANGNIIEGGIGMVLEKLVALGEEHIW